MFRGNVLHFEGMQSGAVMFVFIEWPERGKLQTVMKSAICLPYGININPLNTKGRLLYLKTQFVPRSKHFSSRL